MIDSLALAIKLVGVGFLIVATVGLLRFDDPFQRMHAATKAGTLGAGLVLIGTMLNKGSMDAALTGGLTLLFLLLTIPVASHLLARAAYISGAQLAGVGDADALRDVIDRFEEPIEKKLERVADAGRPFGATGLAGGPAGSSSGPVTADPVLAGLTGRDFASLKDAIAPERVRFAAVGGGVPLLAHRAADFAARTGRPLTAVIAVDTRYVDATGDSAATMRAIRDRVCCWLPDLRDVFQEKGVPLDLVYEEGDAEALMSGVGDAREFLVLPTAGWADHGVDIATPHATKEPDGLLRIANAHPGPVMYAVDEQKSGPVVVSFDNSYDIWRAMDLALVEGLWSMSELRIVGFVDDDIRAEIERRAEEAGVPVVFVVVDSAPRGGPLIPADVARDAVAVILPDLPRPLRTRWYGMFWQDKISPGWRGDVLVWT